MTDKLAVLTFFVWMLFLAVLVSPLIILLAIFPLLLNPHFLAGGIAGLLFYWCFLA